MPPYEVYQRAAQSSAGETLGQCWTGETVPASIELCEGQTILPSLLAYLPPGGRILEAGCGLGRWVFYLRQKGYDVTGIDLARSAVELANRYDPSAPILLEDVLSSPFPSGSFDAVISLGVVEHFQGGPDAALQELRRLLRDDGLLFISVPLNTWLRRIFTHPLKDWQRRRQERRGIPYEFEEYRYTREEFERYLDANGFEPLHIVADDFRAPMNLGLYTDFGILRSRRRKWELNPLGRVVAGVCHFVSPWLASAGAHWVCRKRPGGTDGNPTGDQTS